MSEEITRWRKKPVVIEAVQLTDDNAAELAQWSGGREASIWQVTMPPVLKARLVIPTLEGDHLAVPGDWIIRGVKGEFYPCKPDIFQVTYEPAADEDAPGSEPQPAPELAALQADRDRLAELVCRYERITTSWARGMYSAWIDCMRGDVKAAVGCLSEGLDGYDGTEWNRTETGAEWWERTKAEEGL